MSKLIIAALALFSTPLLAQSVAESIANDDVVHMESDEPAMRKAFEVARDTLDEFLRIEMNPAKNQTSFALKVGITQGGDTEFFWVTDFASNDGQGFVGSINNEPRMIDTVKMGQRYQFTRTQIVDWTYVDESQMKMMGNFTLCALLTKESKEEADSMKKRFNLDCSKVTD